MAPLRFADSTPKGRPDLALHARLRVPIRYVDCRATREHFYLRGRAALAVPSLNRLAPRLRENETLRNVGIRPRKPDEVTGDSGRVGEIVTGARRRTSSGC